ncbi:heme A synthase [Cellulomonas sp. HZM]|uniref:COX15/CtaA family protein n=1 Tax=Cellulomonas sp. HZM TaxID=1454010 RepID=UPI000691D301|nr:COX15/CtaA family protein [Cellulomonas sp. HZM]
MTTSPATTDVGLRARALAWLRARTRAVLVLNVLVQVLIVATGGAVRLTASGLGCSTWPQCEPGHFTPQLHGETSYHTLVEFGNRTMTFLLTAVAVAVAYVVWTDRSRSLAYRRLGLVPGIGVIVQAVVGGITVHVDLNPAIVSSHFLLSMALVSASTLLLHRFSEGDGPPVVVVDHVVRVLAHVLAALLLVVLVLGTITTGAGPHSGDDEVGYRFAVDPLTMAHVHATAVWVFAAVLVAIIVLTRPRGGARSRVHTAALVLAGLVVLQGAIGYVQVATGLPIALVDLHLVGAALLTAGTTRVWLCTRDRSSVAARAEEIPVLP